MTTRSQSTTFGLVVNNIAPTVAADDISATVNEGDTATMTGTFNDIGDDIVTVTASVGTITQGDGTWSWSYTTSDGPAESQVVTVTATDSDAESTTTFGLTVNNVTPTVASDDTSVTVNENVNGVDDRHD